MLGTTLQNRYQLEAELGQGGMGAVYRGHDLLLDRPVAIKVLRKSNLGSQGRARLLNEAQAVARLHHPHIVTVYDAGDANGEPYIVMQLVPGQSLFERRPVRVDEIVSITRQVCLALEHAHSNGVIHRDLKPENVLVSEDGMVWLTDFGLARSMTSRLAGDGEIAGTVFYMAPELALGQDYDGRVDLYSLGVMLYELLAGRLPFIANDPISVISQHLYTPVVPPSTYNNQIPAGLEALILRLMSKDPAERPASASEVVHWLDHLDESQLSPAPLVSPLERLARGRWIGRSRELNETLRAWQQAVAGHGQALLISGEPGIGKTRLVRELATRSELAGGIVLSGACFEESCAPYAPLSQMVRQALALPEARALSSATLLTLQPLLPDQALLPDLSSSLEGQSLDPSLRQQRLFDGLVECFRLISLRRPLLLLFEDAHWADSATLAWVRQVSRRLSGLPVLLVLTYRELELGEARSLADLLYDLERERLATRIKLSRFSQAETEELLGVLFDGKASPELLERIFQETEGNPFFIEEVCKAMIDDGQIIYQDGRWQMKPQNDLRIPQSVRMAIYTRVERLPRPAQEALRLAAVFGRQFDFKPLQAVSDLDEDALIDALETAERAQLISEQGVTENQRQAVEPSFVFTHALIPSALLDEMSSMRRQRLHRRVGLALEELYPDRLTDLAPRLSRHFIEAGDHARAARYLVQAGDQALRLYDYLDASRDYESALEYLREQGEPEQAARLLMKLGLVYHLVYDFTRSRQMYNDGFTFWQRAAAHPPLGQPEASRPLRTLYGDPKILDPGLAGDVCSGEIIWCLFDGLAELSPDGEITPCVASSWEVLEDGRRYVFSLRRDVFWSDGVPVTAHDFVFAWQRVLDPALGSQNAPLLCDLRGAQAYMDGQANDPASLGVKALDDWTLEVELEQPIGYFMYLIANYILFPVPRHVIREKGADWTRPENLVTNGPFRLTVYKPGQQLVLERAPRYHGHFSGNLRQVDFNLDQNLEDRNALYESGQVDGIALDARSIQYARYSHPEEYRSVPSGLVTYLVLASPHPPLDNPLVRQAMVHAIDREFLANRILFGESAPATGGFVPPVILGHSTGIGLPYDPDRARGLLSQAGFPGGQGLPELEFAGFDKGYHDSLRRYVQQQWREQLGIKVKLASTEDTLSHLVGHVLPPRQVAMMGWRADYPDADNYLRVAAGRFFRFAFDLPGYREWVETARVSNDPAERQRLYRAADRILIEEAIVMPLLYPYSHLLIKPWVRNYPNPVYRDFFFKYVVLDAPEVLNP